MSRSKRIQWSKVVPKFDAILERGLCSGVGDRDGQMCIEAAICAAFDEPHGDEPSCVTPAVRAFKIALNDKLWSSPQARAAGLRDLGIAQIGSKGVVQNEEFLKRLAEKTIRVLVPTLFREVFPTNEACLTAAKRCEKEGSSAAAYADASHAASYAANAAHAAHAAHAADKYLLLVARLGYETLRELGSPGVKWLEKNEGLRP